MSSVGAANATASAAASSDDFTFGTTGVQCVGPGGPVSQIGKFQTPGAPFAVTASGTYQANNSEIMAVLTDMEVWPMGAPTINKGHVKNPQKTKFLTAEQVGTTNSPGLGPDGVYRDPWGNPYIITVDMNYDDKARDALYRLSAVSDNGSGQGLNGLILKTDSSGNPVLVGGQKVYEANTPVMVWSAGVDKSVDPAKAANQGANKDNIISWKQ